MIHFNLHPICRYFQVRHIEDYWSNVRCRHGVPVLMHLFGVKPETYDHEVWPKASRHIALSFGVKPETYDHGVWPKASRHIALSCGANICRYLEPSTHL